MRFWRKPTVRARPSWALLLLGLCACSAALEQPAPAPAAPGVTLRFRPGAGARYREHWVGDLVVPGEGLRREALSFDVAVQERLEEGSYSLSRSVRDHLTRKNGAPAIEPSLRGSSLSEQWGGDRSLIAELAMTARTPPLSEALRELVQSANFGALIEYPEQAVALRDSWSIEPRTHGIPSGLSATLRPTYTLEALEQHQGELEAVIATDIQVDLVPSTIADDVRIEGGGSASGSLRVRVRDGILREARTVLHFSQEVVVQGSEVLGFREISATSHVYTTAADTPPPALGLDPVTLEPAEDDRECAQSLRSTAQRMGKLKGHQRGHLIGALHGDDLPEARGGAALKLAARNLVLTSGADPIELDGAALETKDLGQALQRPSGGPHMLYVYADAALPLDRLRSVLAGLPRSFTPRLIVRDPAADAPAPRASRWLEARMRQALSARQPAERRAQLHALLLAHVTLCGPALDALRSEQASTDEDSDLPAQIVNAFGRCGCTSTNLEGLEATLIATFGSLDLRSLPLPRRARDARWTRAKDIRELAALLSTRTAE